MIDLYTADELDQLAARIAQIRPMSNSNPHAFYEERSEVASKIRGLAAKLRNRTPEPAAAETPAAIGRQTSRHSIRHLAGRTVLVLNRRATEAAKASAHPFY